MSYKVITEVGTEYTADTIEETKELIRELTEAEWRAGEDIEVIVRNDDGEEVSIFALDQLDNVYAVLEIPKPTSIYKEDKKTSRSR